MTTQLGHYVRACVPETYTILGVKLRPFCLGHYFLMHRFECAFVSEKDSQGGILDLLLGIAICSRTYEEFLEFIANEGEFDRWMKAWSKHIAHSLKHDKTFVFLHKMMMFQDYMRNSIVVPKFFVEKEGESSSGAHWTQSLLNVLISELGYTHTEAINMPLSKALADYFKFMEKNGMVTLMSDDELAEVAALEGGSEWPQ